jgi:CxxC motif-containing protein (DUF1111 family)
MKKYCCYSLLFLFFTNCTPNEVIVAPDEDIELGGKTSVDGSFVQIFQQPAFNLNAAELELHRESDRAFGDIFVTAPSINNSGLGPVFNQASCESCHVSNGRSPFPQSENDLRGLVLRISINGVGQHGEPLKIPNFGGQLQTKSTFSTVSEGKLTWKEVEDVKEYLDGEKYSLRKFDFKVVNAYLNFPNDALISPRIAPPMIGLGLLEAIRESDIVALADPNDSNNDGISGKINRVWDYQKKEQTLGRFGWKASEPNLIQQTAAAYNNDMGITNPIFREESSKGQSQSDGLKDEPEIDEKTLKAATFYPQSLAVPKRRNWDNANVQQGKILFTKLQCASCHNPKFVTGNHFDYTFLSNQTIFPYTDMLLHDMGDGLADNRTDFEASGKEWRTPPLWGIGLTKTVGGHTNFLHDGRARNLEEAILWHDGEAQKSKNKFKELTKSERNQLVQFIESL